LPFQEAEWKTILQSIHMLSSPMTYPHAKLQHAKAAAAEPAPRSLVRFSAGTVTGLSAALEQAGGERALYEAINEEFQSRIAFAFETGAIKRALVDFDKLQSIVQGPAFASTENGRPSAAVLEAVVNGASLNNRADVASLALDLMSKYEYPIQPALLAAVSLAHVHSGHLDDAAVILKPECSPLAFLRVINAFAEAAQPLKAFMVLRSAQNAGHLKAVDDSAHKGIFNVSGLHSSAISMILFDGIKALRESVAAGNFAAPQTLRIYHNPADRLHIRGVPAIPFTAACCPNMGCWPQAQAFAGRGGLLNQLFHDAYREGRFHSRRQAPSQSCVRRCAQVF
jgi:hypothetical protein